MSTRMLLPQPLCTKGPHLPGLQPSSLQYALQIQPRDSLNVLILSQDRLTPRLFTKPPGYLHSVRKGLHRALVPALFIQVIFNYQMDNCSIFIMASDCTSRSHLPSVMMNLSKIWNEESDKDNHFTHRTFGILHLEMNNRRQIIPGTMTPMMLLKISRPSWPDS